MSDETWKPVVGFENLYEVSDLGRVRSVDRFIPGRWKTGQNRKGRVLSLESHYGGYKQVQLCREGTITRKLVHRLVLEAFVGPCPLGLEACHDDDDPANNRLTNLRWDTRSANNRDKLNRSRQTGQKLTWDNVRDIRVRLAAGEPQPKLATEYGVARCTISQINTGKKWREAA